ncbi:MAG: hypothetical protein HND56_08960 [Pseudomonadota bacterium]|jgi:hypothetical protein|nr:hypothetical protein [Pseudomonadota bacterium]QKK05809.1 MAG: hypothetical protein HND56_08960 [Pseudomonadota bacterium]
MTNAPFEFAYSGDSLNPLDLLEELAHGRHWLSERVNENLMYIQAAGKNSQYKLQMEWDDEFNALQLSVPLEDVRLKDEYLPAAAEIFMKINDTMWMGHFDLSSGENRPTFRHTSMLHTVPSPIAVEMIADITEIAITECDRFYMTFKMLASGDIRSQEAFSIAMFRTAGEA